MERAINSSRSADSSREVSWSLMSSESALRKLPCRASSFQPLSREDAELNREGGNAAGSLAKTQKTLRGLLSPDRVIENPPHFFDEGEIVKTHGGTTFPHGRRPGERLTSQRADQVGDP